MTPAGAYDPAAYGDLWADAYDAVHEALEVSSSVQAVAALAAGGRVLELGVGTGRLALPLAARGVEVHGIEASARMIAKLREKPGGEGLPVTLGDFTEVVTDGTFSLVVCAFNTLFSLPTQERQVRCFEQVACQLVPGGRFVVEASVPQQAWLAGPHAGSGVQQQGGQPAEPPEEPRQGLAIQHHDVVCQRLESVYVHIGEAGPVFLPIVLRYAWPSEMDLMARLAGLDLENRSGDWSGAAFAPSSHRHVSVYRRPA